jgi:O-6-methylguanine DNA methyltransferase
VRGSKKFGDLGFGGRRHKNGQELAAKAGSPKAARAIGGVMAKNPLPLIVPCHRVVRSDGKIGGFSAQGGTKFKNKLLKHEKIHVPFGRSK